VIQSKAIPINSPRDNQKICDLSFKIFNQKTTGSYSSTYNNIHVSIDSTPVAEPILFEANVAILDGKMSDTLQKAEVALTKFEKNQKIQPAALNLMDFSTLTGSKERYLADNGVLNVRCEVTLK
jgi:hypothetical protein